MSGGLRKTCKSVLLGQLFEAGARVGDRHEMLPGVRPDGVLRQVEEVAEE